MKKNLLLVVAAILAIVAPFKADAQFHFGPKLGLCVNELHFSEKAFSSENQAGFAGGLMAEFTVPMLGLGADVSVMYVHRNNRYMSDLEAFDGTAKADYIDVPLNLKWKIGIPVISKILTPFLTTGPDFAFLCSNKTVSDIVHMRSFDFAWNFGFGVQLVGKVQLAASYGLGLTKAVKTVKSDFKDAGVEGKNRYWTITAAYLF